MILIEEGSPAERVGLMRSLGAGLAGAAVLTALHEGARKFSPDSPRVDLVGMRALSKGLQAVGFKAPRGKELHRAALVGDLLSNTVFYALAGAGKTKSRWWKGLALGSLAGLGAVELPPLFKLGRKAGRSTSTAKAKAFFFYLAGGLVAAALVGRAARAASA